MGDDDIIRDYLGGLDMVAWRGGEIMHLSRVLGHSSVKVTEIYFQDVQSRQACMQHTKCSPLGDLKLPKPGRSRRGGGARGTKDEIHERQDGGDANGPANASKQASPSHERAPAARYHSELMALLRGVSTM